MYDLANTGMIPWMVGDDFNFVSNEEEKLGRRPITNSEGFEGRKYTWWNGRTYEKCIFKILDRVLCNDKLHNIFPVVEIEHLIRSGSDHTPLSIIFKATTKKVSKPFRSLNFWIEKESFIGVVRDHWKEYFEGDISF
ncbi:hypothetical protein H5410_022113 [Solanum commersonii]|uniref:Endonuclease/exonuclease/phosphatase domain-containing protein n=1 Tax=Solanum commersonii TaxID=4109 RepID=A0A9J5ZG79_SOLCO|nr:hypothetical protein H5410_022113 [Solanum commersonii]